MKHAFKQQDQCGKARSISGPDRRLSKTSTDSHVWSTGFETIDACLPDDGLSRAGLHEIEPLRATDMPSLTGFAFALLSRLRSNQAIIWCVTAQQIGEYGEPYAFGLERYGISPSQIIFTKVHRQVELQFALEEAIKTDGVAAILGEGPSPSFTGSRRLSLLCRAHKRPCLLMNSRSDAALGSAALTRWQIMPEHSVEDPRDPYGPGLPTWRIALPRVRSGKTMPPMHADMLEQNTHTSYPWRIYWDDQTHSFCSASLFSNRTLHQNPASEYQPANAMVGRRA